MPPPEYSPVPLTTATSTSSRSEHGIVDSTRSSVEVEDQPPKDTPEAATDNNIPSSPSHLLIWPWALDIAAILGSIGLLIALFSILGRFEGDRFPEWKYEINLSSLVAIITFFHRAFLIYCVARILSQLKWGYYFEGPHKLDQLGRLDYASRGALGSFKLLIRPTKFLSLSTLAAAIIVASIAVEPAAQQSLGTRLCQKPRSNDNSTMAAAHSTPTNLSSTQLFGIFTALLYPEARNFLISGLLSPGPTAIQFHCSTGNCTYQDNMETADSTSPVSYSSLGVCSKCHKTVPDAVFAVETETIYDDLVLPVPGFGNVSHPDCTSYDLFLVGSEKALLNDRSAEIEDFFVSTFLYVKSPDCVVHKPATYCTLQFCIKDYKSEIQNGQLHETIVAEHPLTRYPSSNESITNPLDLEFVGIRFPCTTANATYRTLQDLADLPHQPGSTTPLIISQDTYNVPRDCAYTAASKWADALYSDAHEYFSTKCNQYKHDFRCDKAGFEPWFHQQDGSNEDFHLVEQRFKNFTEVITTLIRNTGVSSFQDENGNRTRENVLGLVQELTQCATFQPLWLLIPVVLTTVTTIMLGFTIAVNVTERHKMPPWFESIFPLVFHGFQTEPASLQEPRTLVEDASGDASKPMVLKDMKKRAEELTVRFDTGVHGERVGFAVDQ